MSDKPREFDKRCELCRTPVRVVGETTKYYESAYSDPEHVEEIEELKKDHDELKAELEQFRRQCARTIQHYGELIGESTDLIYKVSAERDEFEAELEQLGKDKASNDKNYLELSAKHGSLKVQADKLAAALEEGNKCLDDAAEHAVSGRHWQYVCSVLEGTKKALAEYEKSK